MVKPKPASGAEKTTQMMNYVGCVAEVRDKMMTVEVKNRFEAGEQLEILSPNGVHPFVPVQIIREDTGEEVQRVTVAGQRVRMPVSAPVEAGDYLRGINRSYDGEQL